jgi:hypothetical protein
MTDEMIALSRRAVACTGWRWMPGMLAHFEHDGRRVRVGMPDAWASTTAVPDLTDPATLGCLLALVREAWGCVVVTSPDYDEDDEGCQEPTVVGWRAVETVRWMPVGEGKTEAEALVVALEAAP